MDISINIFLSANQNPKTFHITQVKALHDRSVKQTHSHDLNMPCSIELFIWCIRKNSPVRNSDVQRFVSGIIKRGTVLPIKHSQPMPISPFTQLYSWRTNNGIPLKHLRMKTVTLIALTCMTRPSVLAPKGIHLDPNKKTYQYKVSSCHWTIFSLWQIIHWLYISSESKAILPAVDLRWTFWLILRTV